MGNEYYNQLNLLDLLDAIPPKSESGPASAGAGAESGSRVEVLVDAARLKNECGPGGVLICGDIAASYSADLMSVKREGDNIRKPFIFHEHAYVCTGMVPGRFAYAYRLVLRRDFDLEFGRERKQLATNGYHGSNVRYRGEDYALAGPEIGFKVPAPFSPDDVEYDETAATGGIVAVSAIVTSPVDN